MKRFGAALLAACLASCTTEPSGSREKPVAPASPPAADGNAPGKRPHLVLETESALTDFVDAHATGEIEYLSLNLCNRPVRLSPLSRLKGVDILSLWGFRHPPTTTENGRFTFAPGLTDDQVRDIAELRTLQRLDLWYCSLSTPQRALLRERLPPCRLRENLNKL
jgi:hypothetical protein